MVRSSFRIGQAYSWKEMVEYKSNLLFSVFGIIFILLAIADLGFIVQYHKNLKLFSLYVIGIDLVIFVGMLIVLIMSIRKKVSGVPFWILYLSIPISIVNMGVRASLNNLRRSANSKPYWRQTEEDHPHSMFWMISALYVLFSILFAYFGSTIILSVPRFDDLSGGRSVNEEEILMNELKLKVGEEDESHSNSSRGFISHSPPPINIFGASNSQARIPPLSVIELKRPPPSPGRKDESY